MERKKYSKPFMIKERFVPQEYVAVCPPDSEYVTYLFECNGTSDSSSNGYDVYLETNGNNTLDIWLGAGILGDHKLTGWLLLPTTWYSPCGETHQVTVPKGTNVDDIFPHGYIVHSGATDLNKGDAVPVRVWTNNNTNIHTTRTLLSEDFVVKNPS